MMNTKANELHYSLLIQWEPQGQVYVVSVPELDGLHTHGTTYEEAIKQAQEAIESWIMDEDPATLPKPQLYPLDEDVASLKAS